MLVALPAADILCGICQHRPDRCFCTDIRSRGTAQTVGDNSDGISVVQLNYVRPVLTYSVRLVEMICAYGRDTVITYHCDLSDSNIAYFQSFFFIMILPESPFLAETSISFVKVSFSIPSLSVLSFVRCKLGSWVVYDSMTTFPSTL